MKRIALTIAFLLLAQIAYATNCTLSGTVKNVDGTVCANCTITFNPATQQPLTTGGTAYTSQPVSTTTDSSGNMTAIVLPQGLIVNVTIAESGATFGGYTAIVPFMSTATFVQMNQGISTQSLDALASSQPPTGPLSMNNQKITNLGCGSTGGDAVAWNCNATLANLTLTGSLTQNTSGMALNGLLTDTQIATPSAPSSVVAVGVTGATSYYYFVVCHDGNGGTTLPSTGTNVANSNATLTSSNYNTVTWTFPTHAINCDVLRNTTNTTTGATSCTNGLAVTSSPFNDQNNTTAAYTIPSRNTTGDGQFAGALSAGTVPTGIVTGDLSTAESATTGKVWFGSNASQGLDFGVTHANRWFLGGGVLEVGADSSSISPVAGDIVTAEGSAQKGAVYFGIGGVSTNHHLDYGVTNAGHFTLSDFGGNPVFDIGSSIQQATLNLFDGGVLNLKGSSSGSAGISVAAAAGTPTTLKLPTTDAKAGQFLQNDGSANLSWATAASSIAHGVQLFTSNGTFTVPAGVYSFYVECWGSGGGGGGYGAGFTDGGNGGATTVGSVCTANGGTKGTGVGAGSIAAGGAGGTVAGAVGTFTSIGNDGFGGNVSAFNTGGGGRGGSAPRGNGFGGNPVGGGVGGAGGGSNTSQLGAGGGGSGAYSEAQVTTTPGTTYTVTLGTAGTAGTGGTANGQAGGGGQAFFTW